MLQLSLHSPADEPKLDVYSLSQDSPTVLTNWKSKQELPFGLLSDPTQSLIKQLGGVYMVKAECCRTEELNYDTCDYD